MLKSNHYLLWGNLKKEERDPDTTLIATSSFGTPEIRIWQMQLKDGALTVIPHIRIETSLADGIKYLLESSET